MRITYDLDGIHFPSQLALETEIKAHLRKCPRDDPFRDTLLAAVINGHHFDVIAAHQHATGYFELLTWREQVRREMPTADQYRGGELLMAYFKPLNAWRDCTVYPWKRGTATGELVEAMRCKAALMEERPLSSSRCVVPECPARGSELRYHHITPTFAEMAAEALKLITPDEREHRFGYNKFEAYRYNLADFISDIHPAVCYLREAHKHNQWEWRCNLHHVETHR